MKISDKDFDKLISVAISQISDDDNVELKTDEELRSEGGSAHEFSPAFEKQKLNHGDLKAPQGDTGHAQIDMITSVYAHILDEDRKINA